MCLVDCHEQGIDKSIVNVLKMVASKKCLWIVSGSVRNFKAGYKELVKKISLVLQIQVPIKLNIIDKINIFYKTGLW